MTSRYTLVDAARNGSLAEVRSLLDGGAPIDSVDEDSCTPLHAAASEGEREIVQLLLGAGADTAIVDAKKFSTLH